MKNLIYLFGILSITLVSSCARKATTYVNKESVRIDTFYRYREVTKTIPQRDSIVIFNPCDSAGILNNFYTQISIPNGKVEVQSKNNKIIATVAVDEKISVSDSTSAKQISKSTSVVEKLVVKNVIPAWIIVALFFETMIILLYLYFKFIFPK
jgi:hypothetical protein